MIGTVVDCGRGARDAPDIRALIDMRDDRSPLNAVHVTETEAVLAAALARKPG